MKHPDLLVVAGVRPPLPSRGRAERNVKLVIARELGAVRDMLGQLDSGGVASERGGLRSPSGGRA
jgi:hypothetical protein